MSNDEFLKAVQDSFMRFLETETSRSNEKLKPLHGAIAEDLAERLGPGYQLNSLGFGNGREISIAGRYMEKKTDIAISRGGKPIAGVAVKFVMQNYAQNSNNYFENMLGETANLRAGAIPYFQVFVILDRMPYYKRDNTISDWEEPTTHNIEKYIRLDNDDPARFFHTPDKFLFYPVHLPEPLEPLTNKSDYMEFYRNMLPVFGLQRSTRFPERTSRVVLREWEPFAKKVFHTILAI